MKTQEIMQWAEQEIRGRGLNLPVVFKREAEGEGLLAEMRDGKVLAFVLNLARGPYIMLFSDDQNLEKHVEIYMVCEHDRGISGRSNLGTAPLVCAGVERGSEYPCTGMSI